MKTHPARFKRKSAMSKKLSGNIKDSGDTTENSLKETGMLWTIFVVLLVLWGLGVLTGYTLGGVIHALLVIAIIVVLLQVIQGRRRI
jgi:predicted ferric reductase